ncbi:MAG: xanthine dehydrogenase family protein subunit M [Deltaproteobacteria bacterium]|nr:xanthine dehydrogenase family protein subunit M [Deltaproteobacteria bacterium]
MENTDFIAPNDVATVCNQIDRLGEKAHLLAGGTDLMVAINLRRLRPEKLIYLGQCGLDRIEVANQSLVIGATATLKSIIQSEAVKRNAPLLVDACQSIGSPAIRNAATLGGNVCNASPSADGAIALLALDTNVTIVSTRGERSVALKAFFTGPGKTVLEKDELVKEFIIPAATANSKFGWAKIGQRKAEIIGIVCVAVNMTVEGGKCQNVRIALGAVAPTPILATKAAALLEGKVLDAQLIAQAAQTAADEISPIDDIRASAWYRKQMTNELVARILSGE